MSNFWIDLRYAARKLVKSPAFTVTAVLTLALGIGASTAIFSLVDTTLLRPLPMSSPDRLVIIRGIAGPERDVRWASYPEIRDWRSMTRSFSDISVYTRQTLNLNEAGSPETLKAELVSPGYFELLGVSPTLGRGLLPDDDRPNVTPAVVISYALWQRRFDGAENVLGRTVSLDNRRSEIVGVMPEGFLGLSFDTEVWGTVLPFAPEMENERGARWLPAIGRLAPGVSKEAAESDIASAARRLEEIYPTYNTNRSADIVSMHEYYLGDARVLLLVVLGAVGFLLVIASVNVINLQIMRGIGRRGEIALRYALGASRGRLLRQLAAEATVLALLGGVVGVVVAYWGLGVLGALIPAGALPGYVTLSIDARVLTFAAGVTALTGVAAGIVPGLRGTRRSLRGDLGGTDRATLASSAGRSSVQRALVTVEIALAVGLMGTAALMARSFAEQLDVVPGFDPRGVLAANVYLPDNDYDRGARMQFARRVIDALEPTAGVESVAVASDAPLLGSYSAAVLSPEERPDDRIRYYRHAVTPEFFGTLGIAMLSGRGFTRSDAADAPRVAVVSDSFAHKIWPGLDAIGRTFRIQSRPGDETVTVVGVAADVRNRDLTTDLMDPGEDPDVYFPFAQSPTSGLEILVRSATSAPVNADVIRRAVAALDGTLPLTRVQTLDSALASQTGGSRAGSAVLGIFAALAMSLSAIGLYGVMAFLVVSRRRELAVRTAVGATPSTLLRMVIGQGMALIATGAVAGIAMTLIAGRLLSSILFGVAALDPAVFASAAVLSLIGLAACAIPARWAAAVNPADALRHE